LVVGPNRLFLGYIERVLPSLGEAGVEMAVLADLLADPVEGGVKVHDFPPVARIKGDVRMVKVLAKAVRDRERPLRRPLEVSSGLQRLTVSAEQTAEIVAEARRRFRVHNAGRRFVETRLFEALADASRTPLTPAEARERLRLSPEVREALERMWPVLTPEELLHDLFGSRALIDLAARRYFGDAERSTLLRPRRDGVREVVWTHDDVPLLDEARELLGPKPRRRRDPSDQGDDEPRTYGHIVVDEAQDLSPMELRMLGRRSLNGSMTVVGDIAQGVGVWAHSGWDDILAQLPQRRPARRAELTIGYRIPGPVMDLAASVLREAAPGLDPPTSVRQGVAPRIVSADSENLFTKVVEIAAGERQAVDPGNVAVVAPQSLTQRLEVAFDGAGVDYGRALSDGLEEPITLMPVNLVKGLEVDAAVVVEPGAIVEEETQGMRALYVALTRATKRLAIVHAAPLPSGLQQPD
jgi:DNA helicase IV